MEYSWYKFDGGKSIGTIGPEEGKISRDEENSFGARITLEENCTIAPFSITVGIYGSMFHTDFYSSLKAAEHQFGIFKSKVEKIIAHYSVEEKNRDTKWDEEHNQLMEQLTDVN